MTPRGTPIELVFAVKQQNLFTLEKKVLEISTPGSPHYGEHMSSAEVHALTAPLDEHVRAVHNFLMKFGVQGAAVTPSSDFITVTVPVELAEAMLAPNAGAHYMELRHTSSQTDPIHRLRTHGYALPDDVSSAVDLVAPTLHVPTIRENQPETNTAPSIEQPDALFNTPKVLKKVAWAALDPHNAHVVCRCP